MFQPSGFQNTGFQEAQLGVAPVTAVGRPGRRYVQFTEPVPDPRAKQRAERAEATRRANEFLMLAAIRQATQQALLEDELTYLEVL